MSKYATALRDHARPVKIVTFLMALILLTGMRLRRSQMLVESVTGNFAEPHRGEIFVLIYMSLLRSLHNCRYLFFY